MTRHASGVFVRNDRVAIEPGTTVRVRLGARAPSSRAYLLELGMADAILSGMSPAVGSTVNVAITLPGRYIEFEVAGSVTWQRGGTCGVVFDYLTARQAYGIALARELSQIKRPHSTTNETTLAPRIASIRPATPRR
ncbi:MAG TPA: hypothetical protein VHB79_27385 [Polyangiaceae bacterium]|nr:hypothetical protein [Polyangiaceae bacterium]